MKPASGDAGGSRSSLPQGARDFVSNLRRAGSDDADARRRMSSALRTATLRAVRLDRKLDLERAWQRHYALRAAESHLRLMNWYRDRLDNRVVHHA